MTKQALQDRREFIEGNAVAVVAEKDALIARQRQELARLHQKLRALAGAERRRERAEAEVVRLKLLLEGVP